MEVFQSALVISSVFAILHRVVAIVAFTHPRAVALRTAVGQALARTQTSPPARQSRDAEAFRQPARRNFPVFPRTFCVVALLSPIVALLASTRSRVVA